MSNNTAPRGPAGPGPSVAISAALTSSSARWGEKVGMAALAGAAVLSIVIVVGIVLSLLLPALKFFAEVPIGDFLTGTRWAPRFSNPDFGVLPLVTGTLWTTAIGLVVAVPIGLGAATYLSEYAHRRVRAFFKPVLEVLAGIPSVVLGYFAVFFVAPAVLKGVLGLEIGTFSVLSAGIVLGFLLVPTVASVSEDAMSAVPMALRQGSLALGANRMRTTIRVVYPAAASGIMASIVLALSRAVGETMIVAMAAGSQAVMIASPLGSGQTMTGFIAQTATGESTPGTLGYNTLFAVALLLFVITFVINIVAGVVVRRIREEY